MQPSLSHTLTSTLAVLWLLPTDDRLVQPSISYAHFSDWAEGFFLFENERFYIFGVVSHRAFAFLSYVEGPAVAHVLAAGRATVSPLPPLSPLPVVLDMALLQQPLNMSPKGHNMTVQFYTGMGKSRPGHK